MTCSIENGVLFVFSDQLPNGSHQIELGHIDKVNEAFYILSKNDLIQAKLLCGLNEIVIDLLRQSISCTFNAQVKLELDLAFSNQQINQNENNHDY